MKHDEKRLAGLIDLAASPSHCMIYTLSNIFRPIKHPFVCVGPKPTPPPTAVFFQLNVQWCVCCCGSKALQVNIGEMPASIDTTSYLNA